MDVAAWLGGLGLERYAQAFRDAEVTPDLLPELTDADLRELGLPLGPRKAVLKAIRDLAAPPKAAEPFPVATGPERRQLTVMFVDLVGSTALSRRLDPEEMGGLLRAFQDAVAGGIARFDGHVAKFLGDGVLAYFGWPTAQEDAAERAVRTALGLVAAVERLATPDGEALACRVGVATGLVVVGELIGEGSSREEAVVGETPNLAARLQELAAPGTVVIAEGTRRLLGDLFAYRLLAPTPVKGFAEPVRAWRVLGEGMAEGRFEALHATGLTPLVGRDHELALLLDRWERAREGEGQVVLLSGEPGIGKSRLVRALRERLVAEPHTALPQSCSPHHVNTALHPVTGLLGRAAGLRREDSPDAQLDKLEAMLALAVDDPREAAPVLADLLGIPAGDRYPPLGLSPQQKKERTFRALLDQLAGLAARGPVLALYEDVHWADPTTLELIGGVVARAQRLPVLVLISFRPEFIPPWTGYGHATLLVLSRLGRRQVTAIIDRLTGGKALPTEVFEQIVSRTDGVPLFVEELTKAVLESGILRYESDRYMISSLLPAQAIPATLHDSLMARLDRLAVVKEVAQVAAVIGREFSGELLAAVVSLNQDELHHALARLVAAELVFRRGETSEIGYAFRHVLVRDAAYESLLKSRRQELHARIVTVLETRFPEEATAEPELLARHCAGAGLAARAIRYWQMAAERAIGRSANREAIAHCESAEAQLDMMPRSDERMRSELEIQLATGIALRAGKGYSTPEAERVFLRAGELCERLGDRARLAYALRGLWAFYIVSARWPDATRVMGRLSLAAVRPDDHAALSVRYYVEGTTRLFCGRPEEAVFRLREGLRHYNESDRDADMRLSGLHTGVTIRANLSIAECVFGLPERAALTNAEALEVGRSLAHPFSLVHALHQAALLRVLRRDRDAAEALATELRETATRYGIAQYVVFGGLLEGIAIAAAGDVAKGAEVVHERLAALRRIGWAYIVPLALASLASALGRSGDEEAAIKAACEALQMVRANGEFIWEAEALRVLGEVRLAGGEQEAAEPDFLAALDVARRQGAKSFELRAATSLARLWADHGRRDQARDLLAPVHAWFTEGFDTPDLRDAEALLAELGA